MGCTTSSVDVKITPESLVNNDMHDNNGKNNKSNILDNDPVPPVISNINIDEDSQMNTSSPTNSIKVSSFNPKELYDNLNNPRFVYNWFKRNGLFENRDLLDENILNTLKT